MQIHKAPVTASQFLRERRLCLPKRAQLAIFHTRAATKGAPEVNANNHPIPSGHIVGVHNGWVVNDLELFKKFDVPQDALVDSEVIFSLIAHANLPATEALELIEGPAAVAWLDRHFTNELHLARADSNPLYIGQSNRGSLVFASTEFAVRAAAEAVGMTLHSVGQPTEGTKLSVVNGEITQVQNFKPCDRWSGYSWNNYRSNRVVTPRKVTTVKTPKRAITTGGTVERASNAQKTLSVVGGKDFRWISTEMFDPFVVPAGVSPESYRMLFEDREAAIDAFLKVADDNTLIECFTDMHAGIRPGDKVETFLGSEWLEGEVVALPSEFPEGTYIIRIVAGTDAILVSRTWGEFESDAQRMPLEIEDKVDAFLDDDGDKRGCTVTFSDDGMAAAEGGHFGASHDDAAEYQLALARMGGYYDGSGYEDWA